MNHISRLNCSIQVIGQTEAAYHLGTRLEAGIRQHVAEVYSAALDEAFEGDPSVYVMRGVSLRVELALAGGDTSKFVQQVAHRMANAAQRTAYLNDDTVRFEDQADYQAHFIADLLRGQAWDSWLYGPFRQFKHLPLRELLRKILLDDPRILAETLTQVREIGQMENLLQTLPRTTLMEIWDQMRGFGVQTIELLPETWRPFYTAAANLIDRLGMQRRELPSLETVLHGLPNGLAAEIDWRDRQALAAAVMEMLRLLSRQGHARPPEKLRFEAELLPAVEAALQPLDWLDQDYLKQEVLHWVLKLRQTQGDALLGSRPSVATPRQAKCLADLLAVLQAQDLNLNRLQPGSPENALRLIAALSASAPHWQNDLLPPRLIAALLAAWESLSHAYEPSLTLQALQQAHLERALAYLPQSLQEQGQRQLRELLKLGPTATAIVAVMGRAEVSPASHVPPVETHYAGVALLLRAVLDARLPYLLRINEFPNPSLSGEERLQAVLLRCFEAWAGADPHGDEPSVPEKPVSDPGLQILAGLDLQPTGANPLPAFSLAELSTFRETWEENLAGLRLASTGNLADDLLRLWARWLRGFAEASVPFLLENFIQRPGSLSITPIEIRVEMERRSLDIVLEMADYLAPIENISWLGGRRLTFSLSPD